MGILFAADKASEMIPCPPFPSPFYGGGWLPRTPLWRESQWAPALGRTAKPVDPHSQEWLPFQAGVPHLSEIITPTGDATRRTVVNCDGNNGPCQHVKLIS